MNLYHPDKSVLITTPTDTQTLGRNVDEIKEKENKALGVLMEHIESHSRAWAVVGQEAVSRGDPTDSFPGGFCFGDLIERYLEDGHETEDLLAFPNQKYKELSEFSSFSQSEIT